MLNVNKRNQFSATSYYNLCELKKLCIAENNEEILNGQN